MARRIRSEAGFSLAELLVATALLLVVSSIVTQALMQMTKQQQTIWNRTEMHSGVRGATELLQQEVGQAGRIALPNKIVSSVVAGFDPATISDCQHLTVTLSCAAPGCSTASPTDGLWFDAATNAATLLTWLDGDNSETVRVEALNTAANTVQACFWENHLANAPVTARGSFATGVIPPSPPSPLGKGSDGNHLKLYGDINGDGKMVYVEYVCDNGDIPAVAPTYNLYRNIMAFDTPAASKPAVTNSMILLSNVHQNPADTSGTARPCFQYQFPNPSTMNCTGGAGCVRPRRRRHPDRLDAVARSSDASDPAGDQSAAECVAAECLLRLGARQHRLYRSRSVDARHCQGVARRGLHAMSYDKKARYAHAH